MAEGQRVVMGGGVYLLPALMPLSTQAVRVSHFRNAA